jgi:hypothetical protein
MPTGYKVIQLKREVFQVKAFSFKKKNLGGRAEQQQKHDK